MSRESDKLQIEEALGKRDLSLEYCEFEMERLGMRGYLVVAMNCGQRSVWRAVIDDEPHVQLGSGAILYPEEWAANRHPGELAMLCRAGQKLDIQTHVSKPELPV